MKRLARYILRAEIARLESQKSSLMRWNKRQATRLRELRQAMARPLDEE